MNKKEIFKRHLANAGLQQDQQDQTIYAESMVGEFPYAPDGHTERLEGREAVSRFLANIGNFAEGFKIGDPEFIESEDLLIAQYHGEAVFKATGNRYSQDYIVVATIRDGQIVYLKEYYNPIRVLQAMGEMG